MIKQSIMKSKTIQDNDPEEFDRKFNEASNTLRNLVELRWDAAPMCVHFIYQEEILEPETLAEEYELKSEHYYCKDCPFFKRGKNNRCKSVGCKYSPYGTAAEFNPACEFFLKKLKNGEIEQV